MVGLEADLTKWLVYGSRFNAVVGAASLPPVPPFHFFDVTDLKEWLV
jgi:hypothetical protein